MAGTVTPSSEPQEGAFPGQSVEIPQFAEIPHVYSMRNFRVVQGFQGHCRGFPHHPKGAQLSQSAAIRSASRSSSGPASAMHRPRSGSMSLSA